MCEFFNKSGTLNIEPTDRNCKKYHVTFLREYLILITNQSGLRPLAFCFLPYVLARFEDTTRFSSCNTLFSLGETLFFTSGTTDNRRFTLKPQAIIYRTNLYLESGHIHILTLNIEDNKFNILKGKQQCLLPIQNP